MSHDHHHHHGSEHHHPVILTTPDFSLLRLSVFERLVGVMLVVAVLWALVFWALR